MNIYFIVEFLYISVIFFWSIRLDYQFTLLMYCKSFFLLTISCPAIHVLWSVHSFCVFLLALVAIFISIVVITIVDNVIIIFVVLMQSRRLHKKNYFSNFFDFVAKETEKNMKEKWPLVFIFCAETNDFQHQWSKDLVLRLFVWLYA